MKEKSKRAIRRHHLARVKAKRKKYYGGTQYVRFLGKLAHTATLCSCYSCGNARRNGGYPTIAEISWVEFARLVEYEQD